MREGGYDQIVWMIDENIKETTFMNLFFLMKSRFGDLELVTPPSDGTSYNGVIRRSVIDLMKSLEWARNVKIVERDISIDEVFHAHEEERLEEMFGFSFEDDFGAFKELRANDKKIVLKKEAELGKTLH